jgi:hypothetical protein
VVNLNPAFHPEGKRFLVKDYPKDGEWRQLKISAELNKKLVDFAATCGLGADDLFFEYVPPPSPRDATAPSNCLTRSRSGGPNHTPSPGGDTGTPAATSTASGSAPRSSTPPCRPPGSRSSSHPSRCATPTPPGSSPAAQTSNLGHGSITTTTTTEQYLGTVPEQEKQPWSHSTPFADSEPHEQRLR